MSASFGSPSGGGRGSESQDFELNLASIIDCFTVLIAFMLASASFLSLGLLDAGVAAAGTTSSSETPPPVNIAVELSKDFKMTIKVTGKANQSIPITSKAGGWDYETMTQNLTSLKSKWSAISAVTLSAEESIEYKDIVKTMEVARKTLPVVMLGGF